MKETRKITLEEIQLPIAGKIRSYEEYIASILHSDNRYVASITADALVKSQTSGVPEKVVTGGTPDFYKK